MAAHTYPFSHHNTLFKLDTAWSLFFLAELIEAVQPDLPYQSVKGIFHSLQYKTQPPSVLRNIERHRVWVHGCMGVSVTKGSKPTFVRSVSLHCMSRLIRTMNDLVDTLTSVVWKLLLFPSSHWWGAETILRHFTAWRGRKTYQSIQKINKYVLKIRGLTSELKQYWIYILAGIHFNRPYIL